MTHLLSIADFPMEPQHRCGSLHHRVTEHSAGLGGAPGESTLLIRRLPALGQIREDIDGEAYNHPPTPEPPLYLGRFEVEGDALVGCASVKARHRVQ